MSFKLLLLISIILFSCQENRDKLDYETSIASKVYQAQIKYLDKTLFNYSRISKKGDFYFQENSYLDKTVQELQDNIKKGMTISAGEQRKFYEHFEKTFASNELINASILKQLEELPIKTVSDLNYIRLYVKNNFVCLLLNNKLLPYDSYSSMASANKWTINNGEQFEVLLSNTAWSDSQPNDWFLVKDESDSLTKENIIDTLHQEKDGVVYFKTKKYKKGTNTLTFISRLNTPLIDNKMISRQVTFTVK